MDAKDNKQLGLQKAISAHEQAVAALNDLMGGLSERTYQEMLARIQTNIAELKENAEFSRPGDHVVAK